MVIYSMLLLASMVNVIGIQDISAWNYSSAWAASPGSCDAASVSTSNGNNSTVRIWERRRIQDALMVKNYGQLRPFVNRLIKGQPINVLVLGDSIVEFHAGRFPPGSPRIGPRFMYDSQLDDSNDKCNDEPLAWGRSFMSIINITYPNAKHHLFNAGVSGASFRLQHSTSSCIKDFFPPHIDLLVLEHLPFLEQAESAAADAELLLHIIWSHMKAPLPAVLFLNLYRTPGGVGYMLPSGQKKPHVLMRKMEQMRKCVSEPNECAECDGLKLFDDLLGNPSLQENETHRVASHYNMASWSHTKFLRALMRDGVPKQLGMSPCQFFAAFLRDGTHPTELGSMLLADVLTDFIETAVEQLGDQSSAPGLTNISKPLYAQTIPTANCFSAVPKVGQLLPGGHRMQPLNIPLSEGWSLMEVDGGKLRPGFISNVTGARLRISLPLLQPPPAMLDTWITYLKSYQHMGKVSVKCISPCECQWPEFILNAHLAGPMRISIPETATIKVSVPTGSECILELVILEATDSGERKFKVIRAGIGGYVLDYPQKLVALDQEHQQAVSSKQQNL